MGKRAKNKTDFRLHIDKTLKEEFRHYTYANNTDMSKEVIKFIESYVRKSKRQEKQQDNK